MAKLYTTIELVKMVGNIDGFPKTARGLSKRFKNISTKEKNKLYYPLNKFPKEVQKAILKAEKAKLKEEAKTFKAIEECDLSSLLDEDATEIEETHDIVPGLLSSGAYILAGKPKDGKSVLAVNWGLAVSSGAKILNAFPCNQGKVLYLSYEDPKYRVQTRINQMLKSGHFKKNKDFLCYFKFPRMNNGGFAQLENKIKYHSANFAIIDVLAKFRSDDDSKKSSYNVDYNFMNKLHELGINNNTCILLIHHRTKGNSADIMDTFSGSAGLIAPADGLMALSRKSEDSPFAELKIKSKDAGGRKTIKLIENKAFMLWDLDKPANKDNLPVALDTGSKRIRIIKALENSSPANPLTSKQIEQISGCKSHYIKKVIASLVEAEEVYKPRRGQYVYLRKGG